MTTYNEIKNKLTAAGLKAYAVSDEINGGYVAFIHFDDLPEEGENIALDNAIRSFQFDVSDKGLVFKA